MISQRPAIAAIVDDLEQIAALARHHRWCATCRHEVIGDPTLGDAILDRIVHRAHRIDLKGPSLRRHLVAGEAA